MRLDSETGRRETNEIGATDLARRNTYYHFALNSRASRVLTDETFQVSWNLKRSRRARKERENLGNDAATSIVAGRNDLAESRSCFSASASAIVERYKIPMEFSLRYSLKR